MARLDVIDRAVDAPKNFRTVGAFCNPRITRWCAYPLASSMNFFSTAPGIAFP
jgi:hypothetical protein